MKKSFLFTLLTLLVSFVFAQETRSTYPDIMQVLQSASVVNRVTHWQPIDPPGSSGMTATLVGYVEIDGVEQRSTQLEVGIFHGNICRGADYVSVYIPNQDRYLLYCSFFGLNGEEDTFRIYDHETETELDVSCSQTITYTDNAIFGLPDPYLISFTSNHFEIQATANPEAGGTVTGAGVYSVGETATLSATANYGYTFANWTKDGIVVSNNASYSFTVTASTAGEYIANFNPNSYTITATASPTDGGTIEGAGVYNYGTTATLTATPATGYHFVNWTKNGTVVSTNATYNFTVTANATFVANFQLNSYGITATANPTAGGTVTGAGTYNHFATCTLTATANTGYTFINWTKDGEVVSNSATYSFTVNGSGNYVANFQLNSYEITATANPTAGGNVAGGGTYNHFETCTLTATANEGYTFLNWTKNGTVVSTNATYSFTVTEAASYVANFQLNSYEITATANPEAGGTITGAGTYNHFETCTLTATENEGYTFVNWTKNGTVVSTNASYSFMVTEAASFVANFQLNSYEITATANPEVGGNVTGVGTYNHFETCTLTATANDGYTFINWTKDGSVVSTNASYSFMVTEAASFVANFQLNSYEIFAAANPEAGGTVTGAGTYNHFETCTLTATANEGYTFINWTKDNEEVSTNTSYTFTVTEAASFVANFQLNSYEITVTANPEAGGTITGAGTYNHFETCTLTATENEGYTFVNWTKGGEVISTALTYSFTVTEAASYVANFSLNSYDINATANPEAGGTITGAGTYNHFETCTLTATANEGYTFINWTKDGEVVSTALAYSFTVTEAASYVANFQLNSYEIIATANPEAGGNVTGAGTYNHFETCTLTAMANEGYTFINWTKDGELVSTNTSYSFTVTEAANYVANFQLNSYEISASTNPVAAGAITGAGIYYHFETCTLSVVSNPGYTFLNWTKDGEEVSTNTTISFVVTEAATYVANFEINGYEIMATVNPEEGGSVTGTGVYVYGSTATLTAAANEGYTFINWTNDGDVVSTNTTYSFTVTEAVSLVANFQLNSYEITAAANPEAGGTITGAGTYNHFETCTLTATANEGYTFINWTKNGEEVSNTPTYSFTVTEAAAFVAHFTLNSYEITATANPEAGGTVTGSGTFNHFETCTLTATVNEGYSFVNWTKDGEVVSITPVFSFTVTEAATYVANFSLNSYEITATANPEAGGTVTGAGTYNHFETCTLTATANEGYTFINWTKDGEIVATTEAFSFTVTEAGAYVAHFSLNSYEIIASTNPIAAGSITGAGTYYHFETCTLSVVSNPGYTFLNWTKDGIIVATTETFSFTVTETAAYVANFEINGYEISATVNPEVGGSVSGTGVYVYGSTATLTATANEGYTFINWTNEGEVVSTNTTYSFTVTEAVSLVANFQLNSYEITASANPIAGGTITGAGTYNHFETCTLTASENEGYTFVNWTKDGEEVSTALTYSFTVTEAASYVANFSLNSYEIIATADPTVGGTITGAGTYNHFETCTLTAIENEGYTFINWTKDGEVVSTTPTYSFTVTEAASFVANFQLNSYQITVMANPEAGGTVTGAGTYNHFETCTLTATANEGYTFINWTKDGEVVATTEVFSFTVTEAGTYIAHFSLNSYVITAIANPEAGGTITGAGTYNHFETCTLTITANEGYTFINWTKDGEEVGTTTAISFVVTEAANYVANFQLNSYEITAIANPEVGGIITGAGTYDHFETCTLTATANEGYTFVNWIKDGIVVSTSASYNFTVTETATYVANFSLNSYQITATANPTAGGTITGAGTYNHFETCTLTAAANEGYTFINWTKDGIEVSTSTSYSFIVTEAASYVAHFQINSYEITAIANPSVGGTVTGGGTYDYGQNCLLTAISSEGYTFVNWTKNGQVISTSPNYSFTVTESATYVANFSLNSYQITAVANPTDAGTVDGAGTYNHFETCTLTATPAENYIFLNWTKNGVVVSTDATYSFIVVEASDYVANFAPNEFQINVTANPTSGGIVTGAGVYNYGTIATLTATANYGFTFVNWTKNGIVVSTNATYSFTVTEDGNYIAHFSRNNYVITAIATPVAGGTITGAGTYSYGTNCTLTATAAPGYTFARWTKNGAFVSSSPTYNFAVTEDATYIAHFIQNHYYITVTANPNNGGNVTGEGAYVYGEIATVTAFAFDGYHFVRWTMNGTQVSTNTEYSFTITDDANIVGYFELNQYQINASADPTEGGSVSGSGSFSHGETVTLTATANNGYHFVNWTKNGNQVSTNAIYTFTATETADFVAHFEHTIVTHEVTTESDPIAGGITIGDGTYNHGAYCTVTASANEGYTFINWTKNGNVVSTSAVYHFVVNEDTHLVAHFQPNSYQITASADPQEGGIVSGSGTYTYGQTAVLTVTPNENYVFQNWTEDGEIVSEEATYSFEVTGNRNLVAHLLFVDGIDENNNVDISIYPNPASYKVTVEASQVINRWEIITTTGSLISCSDDNTDKKEFWVNQLAPGTYLIRMTINDVVLTRKFVKKK